MKNLIITLVLVLAYSCGTDQGEGTLYKYTVKNESGKTLIIKSYLSNFPSVSPVITNLSIGEELVKTYQDGLPPSPSGYGFGNFFGTEESSRDSLKIIYDDSKVQFFKGVCSENDRNPLNICTYQETEEIFTFTQQDYENAEDCNGDCD